MARALYRTYRPQKLSEVVGQEHITDAIGRALQNGTISHAYLFTGPRGVGKTSLARILAHEINGLPYEDDRTHLDIIEIDAASNRRIEEIRDLRDKVHVAPSSAKYKVYIIDEVHMLTKEAFNALLKTLEEPPAHVVFILATTEVHKLPETIISRTQRYAFKPVDLPKVAEHLKHLAESEGIDIDDEALALIAAHGDGSFRDSISLLDQVRNANDKVTLQDVQNTLGIAPKELIEHLLTAVAAHDAVAVMQHLHTLKVGGHDSAQVAKQLGKALRTSILQGNPLLPAAALMPLLSKLIEVPASGNPRAYLEIALLDVALAGSTAATAATSAPAPQPKPAAQPPVQPAPPKTIAAEAVQETAVQVEPHPSAFQRAALKRQPLPEENEDDTPAGTAVLDTSVWPQILAAVKAKHNTLYSIVRMAKPSFEPGKIILDCGFPFHQKRLQEARNKQTLSEIIQAVTGESLILKCIVGQGQDPNAIPAAGPPQLPPEDPTVVHSVAVPAAATATPAATAPAPDLTAISNIFGGAEVLES